MKRVVFIYTAYFYIILSDVIESAVQGTDSLLPLPPTEGKEQTSGTIIFIHHPSLSILLMNTFSDHGTDSLVDLSNDPSFSPFRSEKGQ
jgi:hypothetical protein